jgi:hypothetical protein
MSERKFTKQELEKINAYDPNNIGKRPRKTMKVVDTGEHKVCVQVAPGIWKCVGDILLDDNGNIIG